MREGCTDCVKKHLGQAAVLIMEYNQGYKNYEYLIIGHLAEAAEEIFEINQSLANDIRQGRLLWMSDKGYKIPFETIIWQLDNGNGN